VGLRGIRYPVLLDFGHEMNGNWYPWASGVNNNTPAQYIAAFQHVHDRFVVAGAWNVFFVWNPDHWSPSGISAAAFYPGDAYVDVMAIDGYNWNSNWQTPYGVFHTIYDQLTALNSTKPIIIAEVGSQANPPPGASPPSQAAWVAAFAQTLPQWFPRIRAVVWFNELNTVLALNSSPDQLAAAQLAFGGCAERSWTD
jgi:beta-mannanase